MKRSPWDLSAFERGEQLAIADDVPALVCGSLPIGPGAAVVRRLDWRKFPLLQRHTLGDRKHHNDHVFRRAVRS